MEQSQAFTTETMDPESTCIYVDPSLVRMKHRRTHQSPSSPLLKTQVSQSLRCENIEIVYRTFRKGESILSFKNILHSCLWNQLKLRQIDGRGLYPRAVLSKLSHTLREICDKLISTFVF